MRAFGFARYDDEPAPEPVTYPVAVYDEPAGTALFYASRTKRQDASWRLVASCLIRATDLDAARDQLAQALRKRGSAATIEEIEDPAHGILATTMVDPF